MKESDISVANEQIVSDDVDTSRENKRTDIRELPKQVIAAESAWRTIAGHEAVNMILVPSLRLVAALFSRM